MNVSRRTKKMEQKENMEFRIGSYCKISEKSNPKVYLKGKCPDCDLDLDVPADTENGEIYSCPGCGLELEVKGIDNGVYNLQELTIEGEDWGE
jgi:alpha-aminoadipate/glutamate carrier protein LysW